MEKLLDDWLQENERDTDRDREKQYIEMSNEKKKILRNCEINE